MPRLLELFRRKEVECSWFVPGHSIETFPKQVAAIAAAGHEIGAHGYTTKTKSHIKVALDLGVTPREILEAIAISVPEAVAAWL